MVFKSSKNLNKERTSFEERISLLTKELELSKNSASKQQQDLDALSAQLKIREARVNELEALPQGTGTFENGQIGSRADDVLLGACCAGQRGPWGPLSIEGAPN